MIFGPSKRTRPKYTIYKLGYICQPLAYFNPPVVLFSFYFDIVRAHTKASKHLIISIGGFVYLYSL